MDKHEVLINDPQQKKYVFAKLSNLLKSETIQEVAFMVAFITVDGIYLILQELRELLAREVKGLIFTASLPEARLLSELFNQHGYKTCYLSAANSPAEREQAINLLENDYSDGKGSSQEYLDYIFSVDIFSEGIDIHSLNQIVLLRPTQSAIVFVQQLGRGLRKHPSKEYCVIIDFKKYNSIDQKNLFK